jgi:hypothetical protein
MDLQAVISGTQENRVEALWQILDYPLRQRDPEGSRFWFLRSGADEEEAEDTCAIAVGFYAELDGLTDGDNLGFHLCRQVSSGNWSHVLATNLITDNCYVSNQTSERGYTIPLYVDLDDNGSKIVKDEPSAQKILPTINALS